jgi:protein-glutamine gamma-glutamyltransferase
MKHSAVTLCSLSLCLWGYQTGAWNLAIPMILALELRNLIKRRWTISWEHFKFVHVLAAFLWLLSIFYIPSSSPASIPYAASYHILKCLPVGLFPLILFQTYCTNFGNLYGSLLKQSYKTHKNISLYYPYFGICLLSASATGGNTFLFLSITAGLATLFLGSLRSQRFSPTLFYSLIGAALILSIIGTNQFYWLQANIKPESPDFFRSLSQNLTSFLKEDHSKNIKNLFDKDLSSKVEKTTENINKTSLKNNPQSTRNPQSVASPNVDNQLIQSLQNTASQSITQSIQSIKSSQNAEAPQSNPQAAGSSQTAESPQSNSQSTQGGDSPQNITPAESGINAATNVGKQSEQPGNAAASISSQGATESTKRTQIASEPSTLQNISQNEENAGLDYPSQASQNVSQNPSEPSNTQSSSNLIQHGGGVADPQQSLTQIGNTGSLQPSDTILFRVALTKGENSNKLEPAFPLYIREATYNQYSLGAWNAVNSNFFYQNPASNKRHWVLGNQTPNTASVRISAALPSGKSVLKLPIGTSRIDHPTIDAMEVNQYGSVLVQGNPGTSTYTVEFDPYQSLDSLPTQMEMDIPETEKPAIQKILNALNLKGQSKNEAIRLVSSFFKENFKYSLKFPKVQKDTAPLSSFLLEHRSGHCEYFASATSLLLRSIGIPTRYVVGYSVHEYSPSEQEYVVRARNAHAWVMAYVNGSWLTVDTTPSAGQSQNSNRENIEKMPEGGLSPLKNRNLAPEKSQSQVGNARKTVSQGQSFKDIQTFIAKTSGEWSSQVSQLAKHFDPRVGSGAMIILGLLIILISILLAWWVSHKHFSGRLKRLKRSVSRLSGHAKQNDSAPEFYLIEKRLGEWGVERKSSETIRQWILRLKQKLPDSKMHNLNEIIDLHYRYRFDPQGIAQEDCEKLRLMIQSWLMETAA